VRLALSYDGEAQRHTLRVLRSAEPILLNGVPVNAVRTGRSARIGIAGSSDESFTADHGGAGCSAPSEDSSAPAKQPNRFNSPVAASSG
jgi:hypothetical protein